MAMESINGQMVACIKEIGSIIKYQVTVSILGMIKELIRDIGWTITCMAQDRVLSGMQKEIFIEASLGMIWPMVMGKQLFVRLHLHQQQNPTSLFHPNKTKNSITTSGNYCHQFDCCYYCCC